MEKIINMFSRKNTTQEERRARAVSPSRPKRLRDESPTPESMQMRKNKTFRDHLSNKLKTVIYNKKQRLLQQQKEEFSGGIFKNNNKNPKKISEKVKKPKKISEKVKKPKKVSEKVKKPKKVSEKVKKPKKVSEKVKKPKKVF